MRMNTVLALDLSTSCTGFAVFYRDKRTFLRSGRIKPQISGLHKLKYPESTLLMIRDMAAKILALVQEVNPERLVIEEVNRGINRIGQKGLDACHFMVLDEVMKVRPDLVKTLTYIDSNGKKGWRGILGLKLSDQDKQVNAEIRNLNRKRKKKSEKAPLIDWKVLAQRYVNAKFKTAFNVWENPGDNDECDAIALGDAFCLYIDKLSS